MAKNLTYNGLPKFNFIETGFISLWKMNRTID